MRRDQLQQDWLPRDGDQGGIEERRHRKAGAAQVHQAFAQPLQHAGMRSLCGHGLGQDEQQVRQVRQVHLWPILTLMEGSRCLVRE